MPIRTCLFDLDGTLIDHFAAIHRAHVHTLRHFKLPEPTFEQVKGVVGRGLENAIADLIAPEHHDIIPEAVKIYRAYWAKTMLDDVKLLPGARELLERLRELKIRVAVITNKHGPSSREICTHLKIDSLLDGVFGANDTDWLKPDPRFTSYVLAKLGASADSTLLVGDSPYDIATAHESRMPCWCVTTGTHTAAQLEKAGAEKVFPSLFRISEALALVI